MKKTISDFIDASFFRFIIVGVLNTLFGTAVMFIFYNVMHLDYWISSASNYIFGSVLSYFLNKCFTFKCQDDAKQSIVRFIVNISVCYFVAYGLAKPIINVMFSGFNKSLRDNVSMLLGMGLFVLLNYLGQRLFVFKTRKEL